MRCDSPLDNKPRVLYLGAPKHASPLIREKYQEHLAIDVSSAVSMVWSEAKRMEVLDVSTRQVLLQVLPDIVKAHGPYHAVVCRLGHQPFEPFNGELLSPLLPDISVVASAQSGYDDFDVEWWVVPCSEIYILYIDSRSG